MHEPNFSMCWSRGQLECLGRCPGCGIAARARSYARRDDALDMPDVWHMHECAGCGSLYLDPRPDAASIGEAYRHYYTHAAEVESVPTAGSGKLLWSLIHGYLNWRFGMRRLPTQPLGVALFTLLRPWRLKLDYYGRHLPRLRPGQSGRLLDIGAGNGGFLARAREMGWEVRGCEPDASAVQACREQGLHVLLGDAFDQRLEGQTFDVVTVSHVIEHVPDGLALLRRIHQLLEPGGTVWLGLPNAGALGREVFGRAWMPLHCPYHLFIPSFAVLSSWLSGAGFTDIRPMCRGVHASSYWNRSRDIARSHKMDAPQGIRAWCSMRASDLVATIGWRRAEELVVIARKANNSDV